MTHALILEDFSAANPAMSITSNTATAFPEETQRASSEDGLAAFDEGYKSGWDDCAEADAETQRRVSADLAANLRDISMTYAEARRDVLAALGPLFEEVASQLLPVLAAEAVAPAVLSELKAAAEDTAVAEAALIAAPAALPALERLIETQDDLSISLKAEPAYADGQVSLRYGTERRDIDLTGAANRMADAIRAFVAQETGEGDQAGEMFGEALAHKEVG